MTWLKNAFKWLSEFPWRYGGCTYSMDQSITSKYLWCRAAYHVLGGFIVGGIGALIGLGTSMSISMAIVGALLAGVILYKEFSDPAQSWVKSVVDVLAWGVGFLLIVLMVI